MSTTTHITEKGTDTELPANHDIDHVDGGALVYEVETEYRSYIDREVVVCRTLVGFAAISDWKAIRSELIKRGHGVGAIHQLPKFDITA